MTRHDVAVLSFKVLSVFVVIQALEKIYYFFYYLFRTSDFEKATIINLLLSLVPSLLLAICSVLLWFGSPLIAKSIFKRSDHPTESKSSLADVQAVAFSVVGLFLLAKASPEIVEIVSAILLAPNVQPGTMSLVCSIVTLLFEVCIGFWLLFGSRGFVNFLQYLNGKRANF